MIELRDSVEIGVAPEAGWAWLERMPEHALEWHPDHLRCRWLRGGGFVPGARMAVLERLHGKLHHLHMTLTAVEPGRRVQYRMAPGLTGSLAVEPSPAGARFTAIIRMGFAVPVVGAALDWLLCRVIPGRIEVVRRHQAEEGANLKALLEDGTAPAP
jgi:hypothetical protein